MNAERIWKVKRLRKARRLLMSRCGVNSGTLYGHQCQGRFRHKGQHFAVTSVERTQRRFSDEWYESGRTTVTW